MDNNQERAEWIELLKKNMTMKIKCNAYWATLWQVAVALLLLWLTRFAFYWYNADVIGNIAASELFKLALMGLQYDISTIAYANALFIVMRFLPFQFTLRKGWRIAEMIVYGICNSALLIINIGDIPFFRFNGGRLRLDSFLELMNAEMVGTTFSYAGQYWWAFLGVAAMIALLLFLALRFSPTAIARTLRGRIGMFMLAAALTFVGMRGCHITGHPIGIADAAAAVRTPPHVNVVLNSPFCILRSPAYAAGMQTYAFFSDSELAEIRSSIQDPAAPLDADSIKDAVRGKNLMLIVFESGGQLWFDSLNIIRNDSVRGLMPFLDSIASQSMALTETFCTGARTVEGMAAITGGVPTFGQMKWMTSKYGVLSVDTPAKLLAQKGYATEFYIGANPDAFTLGPQARAFGYQHVTGRNEVTLPDNDTTTASWGYWDHIMAPYVAKSISSLPQPFLACWLTLYLHAPFQFPGNLTLPANYPPTHDTMHLGVEYLDYSLRCFFEKAKSQPWYDNTIFVITSDHGFRDLLDRRYNGAYIYGHIPLLLYTPDGSLKPANRADRPMAQFDIAPTLLWLAGYDKPYVAVGTNWFDDTKPHYGVQQRNNTWHLTGPRYHLAIPLTADRIEAVYDPHADQQLQQPLTDYDTDEVNRMFRWFQALLQDYTTRANTAQLAI
ncbi:MAG: sulfatase-like hydrolase/transferase [Bacteroides sp.]|nr:sulfatase-like hydrolase/transferase [Bacteroides sp.]MCM1379437.1 sulfatase-like hydrolase/transferase [Bacteroides sp.]MCM1445298.1 sulfatase-like hydrolase/transferase [Prevotella sp.]